MCLHKLILAPQLSVGSSPLSEGVRGTGGAITMERSEDEKLKYPDRINLDRKGLHGEAEDGKNTNVVQVKHLARSELLF